MNAKELCEAYDGRDIDLHITEGDLTERKVLSIQINRPRDCLKYASVYSFRFEDNRLIMYADVRTLLYNLLLNPVYEEEEK